MKRQDIRPDTIYLVTPNHERAAAWRVSCHRRNPALYDTARYVRVPGDLEFSNGVLKVAPVAPLIARDGYQVTTVAADHFAWAWLKPETFLYPVCHIGDWPDTLERLALEHREKAVEQDAAVLKRREDITLLIGGILSAKRDPGAYEWQDLITVVVRNPEITHMVSWTLGHNLEGGTPIIDWRPAARDWILDHGRATFGSDWSNLWGVLSTEAAS